MKNKKPWYDRKKKCWRVDFPDRNSEEGDLLYVASEFARTGLYFPYNDSQTKDREYSGHDHYFEGVLKAWGYVNITGEGKEACIIRIQTREKSFQNVKTPPSGGVI